MRSETRLPQNPPPPKSRTTPASVKGKAPARSTGLNTPITTPAHVQNQTRQRQVPLTLQEPERRVAFTDPAPHQPAEAEVPDTGDDSFNFGSDDDAFLALVDLGEGDLGRPIDYDEGLGGVSSSTDNTFDHGGDASIYLSKEADAQELPYQGLAAGSGTRIAAMGSGNQQQNHQWANSASGPGSGTSMATGLLSRLLPQQQNQQRPPNPPSNVNTNLHLNAKPLSRLTNRNQNQCTGSSNDNGTAAVMNHPSANTSIPSKRPITPSMGGFHFPPGVASILPPPLLIHVTYI